MDVQSEEPRERMEVMFLGVEWRVGVVDNEEIISDGRLERNAPRQFIVRGTWGGVRGCEKEMW